MDRAACRACCDPRPGSGEFSSHRRLPCPRSIFALASHLVVLYAQNLPGPSPGPGFLLERQCWPCRLRIAIVALSRGYPLFMRAYELARSLGVEARHVVGLLGLRSHLATLSAEEVSRTQAALAEGRLPVRSARRPPFRKRPGPARLFKVHPDHDAWDWKREMEYEPIWSTRDVATYCRVEAATVRQWVRRGHLQPVGTEKGSHIFESSAVVAAMAAIESRTNRRPGLRANIHPRHHGRLVRIPTAAAAVGVAPSTVRSWITRGRLKSTRTEDGHVVVLVADVFRLAR